MSMTMASNNGQATTDEDGGRKALHGYVSDEAHAQWHDYAVEQGISVSALLEALAPEFGESNPDGGEAFEKRMLVLVKRARRIDSARRRRRRA